MVPNLRPEAAEIDGGAGVITDEDGRAVYVEP